MSSDDVTLNVITERWLAKTREHPPRATYAQELSPDDRARRALMMLARLDPKGSDVLDVGEPIGEGGMSVVRRATQVVLGREVAVKTVRVVDDDEQRATLTLLREAWITGALEHPNIVPVHDIAVDASGRPQIVLKRIGGVAWSALMHEEDELRARFGVRDPLDWNLRILLQVASAVHFAHSKGILHRDLKSDNVMIGAFGEVYVLDWGLAVAMSDDGTGRLPLVSEVDSIAGSPAYLAPEMLDARGDRLGPRTDVYLLGGVLYEIVTGWPPHMAGSMPEVIAKVSRSDPRIPPETPRELAGILRRALARDPADRYESADALRLATASFMEHRASIALADDALRKVEELERLCEETRRGRTAERTGGDDERGQRRYHLFGECRFGFREALRTWPANDAATDGLRRAVVAMAELELVRGDPRAAELAIHELSSPPPELAARIREALEQKAEERRRFASMVRDQDPRIGRRVRLWISVGLGGLWTLLPWIGWFIERGDPHADQLPPLLSSTLMLVLAVAIAQLARDALQRTHLNRSLVRAVGVVLLAQVAIYAVTLRLHVAYEQTRVLVLLLYASCCGLTTALVERRLWPSAATYAVVVAIATFAPPWAWPVESVANLVLTLNVALLWGAVDPDDGRGPVR